MLREVREPTFLPFLCATSRLSLLPYSYQQAMPICVSSLSLKAQSHYPRTELTSPFPILIMSSAWLGSDKYTFLRH